MLFESHLFLLLKTISVTSFKYIYIYIYLWVGTSDIFLNVLNESLEILRLRRACVDTILLYVISRSYLGAETRRDYLFGVYV